MSPARDEARDRTAIRGVPGRCTLRIARAGILGRA